MALTASMETFAPFLWLRGDDLSPEAIEQQALRPGSALGPIALGDLEPEVQERLSPARLPHNDRGHCPQVDAEHHSAGTYGNAMQTWRLTSTGEVFDNLQGPRQGWIEWSSSEADPRAVVLVRYCVGVDLYNGDDGLALHAALRDAVTRTHGQGVEHKKKHKRAQVRSTTWSLPDALVTLGLHHRASVRLHVIEMVAAAWKGHDCLRSEYLL